MDRNSHFGSPAGAATAGSALHPCRVLLVEDNELNSEMMTRRLARLGYEVRLARDGAAALREATAWRPDVVLLDMSLPEMDGWEVARRLKVDRTTNRIPVIALTAHAMSGDRERCLEAGCDEFESKPVNFSALTGKMARLTGPTETIDPIQHEER